ncbi:MAG: osmotically inducible protein OsmC [Bacteroidetes bacterium B1(2017)]|nr:MAG: osmotically inducible protein OsmC [Bacteroidetes bacterium B1(2017)]
MATSELIYEGELRCKATHLQSDSIIVTDAPTDNQGKGQAFSPTDLLATSLGVCMLTIMGIEANKHNVNIDGAKISITKYMGTEPRRVIKIGVEAQIPNRNLSDRQKAALIEAGINCPVAKSLHPDLIQDVNIHYFLEV